MADVAPKVVFCIPTVTKPYSVCLESLKASLPALDAAGWEHYMVSEIGNPYISGARSTMLRKALDAKADVIVFIDHDLSWGPEALLKLVETEGDVVAGTYRFKQEEVEYMGGLLPDVHGRPQVREDGCVKAYCIPAGFLKITKAGVNKFMRSYPELSYGPDQFALYTDLFNHGAYQGVWYGEDYSFSRRWLACGGDIWVIPNLNIDHHTKDAVYRGNYHEYLLHQPGGSHSDNPVHPSELKLPVLKVA